MLYNVIPISYIHKYYYIDVVATGVSIRVTYNSLQRLYNNKFSTLRKHICAMMMSYLVIMRVGFLIKRALSSHLQQFYC